MPLIKSDVARSEIITAPELRSDGYGVNSIYLTTTVVSTTSGTKTVVVSLPFSDVSLIWSQDYQVDPGDIVYLYGTSGADGYYTIDTLLTDTSFTVIESINNSTGGDIQFHYPPGADLVGFNSDGLPTITANNVQDAVSQLDQNKISQFDHEKLRQLIHFLSEGPGHGFLSGAYQEITPIGSLFPTAVTWYVNSSKSQKIVEQLITWNVIVPVLIEWNIYQADGLTIAQTAIDTISYVNNIFEASRIRTLI